MSSALLFNIIDSLSTMNAPVDPTEDDPNEVSYGAIIDSLLAFVLPHVMLFFNGSVKRHKQCVDILMKICERIGLTIHLMNEGSNLTHPEGSVLVTTSMKEFMEKYDVEVPDEADVRFVFRTHADKKTFFISSTTKLVTLITYLISTYLPSEWGLINVSRFLVYLSQCTQPSMDVNVNDI